MKKITYLVASLLLMGTTPLLTGCIDTDEPKSIEELRSAKAELLTAKAAVEKAKVATEEANAAYRNAEAEYVKAQAAREKAEAAIKEAEADKLKAETETEWLNAEIAKAKAEQELAEAKAAAEQATKEWELKYKEAEANYEALMVQLTIQTTEDLEAALSEEKSNLYAAKVKLQTRQEELTAAQREYNSAYSAMTADAAVDEPILTRKVELAKNAVEVQEALLKQAKADYEAAQKLTLAEVAEVYAELQKNKAEAEEEYINTLGIYSALQANLTQTKEPELTKQANKIETLSAATQTLPAYSFTTSVVLPYGYKASANSNAAIVSYNDMSAIDNRLAGLNDILNELYSYVRTDGDDATDAAKLNTLATNRDKYKQIYDYISELWAATVNQYKEFGDYDISSYFSSTTAAPTNAYTELMAAVDALNQQIDLYNDIQGTIDTNTETVENATAKKEAAEKVADEAYEKAVKEAESTKTKAYAIATQSAKELYASYQTKAANDKETYQKAWETYKDNQTDANAKASAAAFTAWQESLKDASKTEADIQLELMDEADAAYETAVAAASAAKTTAYESAQTTYTTEAATAEAYLRDADSKLAGKLRDVNAAQKVVCDYDGTNLSGKYKDFLDAVKSLPVKSVVPASKIFYTLEGNRQVIATTINSDTYFQYQAYFVVLFASELQGKMLNRVRIEEVAALNRADLKVAIGSYANRLFGRVLDSENTLRTEAITPEQMHAYLKDKIFNEVWGESDENGKFLYNIDNMSDYADALSDFGYLGQWQYYLKAYSFLNDIAGADNRKAMENDIATIQAQIKTTNTFKANIVKPVEEAIEAYNKTAADYRKDMEGYQAEIQIAKDKLSLTTAYLDVVSNALDSYKSTYSPEDTEYYTFSQTELDNYVATCKNQVEEITTALAEAQSALESAQQALTNLKNNQGNARYDLAKQNLEDAQTRYNNAQKVYDVALLALQTKMEKLNVSSNIVGLK